MGNTADNVLFIVADCLRHDSLPRVGEEGRLPALAALVEDSIRFDRAYAASSWTKTAVASLLTSTFPVAHRAYAVSSTVPAELPTLPAWLQEKGYTTIGITSNVYFADRSGLERGFDRVRYFPDKDGGLITGEFRRQLDTAGGERNFIYLHYMDTHLPFTIHDDSLGEKHRQVVEKYGATTKRSIEDMGIAAAEVERLHDLYLHEVEYFDRLVGEVVGELKARGLYERTLIVLTADHGSEYGEHGSVYHGHTLYEESLRVPLCLKQAGKGEGGGRSVKTVVRHVDLFPTVAGILGLEPPPELHGQSLLPVIEGKKDGGGDSVVFAELLQFPSCHLETVILDGWKLILRNKVSYRLIVSQLWRNLVEGNWYIFKSVLRGAAKVLLKVFRGKSRPVSNLELYYLPDDPGEKNDLSGRESDRVRMLREELDRYRTDYWRYFSDAGRPVGHDDELKERLKALGYVD